MLTHDGIDTTIIVALITGVISLLVSFMGIRSRKRSDDSQAYKNMQETIEGLHRDVKEQDRRIGHLSHLVISEQEQRQEAETRMYETEQERLTMAVYIRAVGHWMAQLCDVLDPQWLQAHPKPHLPDSIRPDVEDAAQRIGLDIKK